MKRAFINRDGAQRMSPLNSRKEPDHHDFLKHHLNKDTLFGVTGNNVKKNNFYITAHPQNFLKAAE